MPQRDHTLLIGTHAHPGAGDGAPRMARAMDSARALRGVELVTLQWPDERLAVPGWRTIARLREDSLSAAGRLGRRKPIVRELFDLLAAEAERRGRPWFCFTNADVRLTQRLVDFAAGFAGDVLAISRTEVDGADAAEVSSAGIDTFVVRTAWWIRHRGRFRGYILGEPVWDNVYAAMMLHHGEGRVLNTPGWTFHERHPAGWRASPFAEYTRWLAALDRQHFTRWAEYHWYLDELRGRGATLEEEMALARRIFRGSGRGAALQLARVAVSGVRYLLRG
jgi:hypothetical protein